MCANTGWREEIKALLMKLASRSFRFKNVVRRIYLLKLPSGEYRSKMTPKNIQNAR